MKSKTGTDIASSKRSTASTLRKGAEPTHGGYHLRIINHFPGFNPLKKPVHFMSLISRKEYDHNLPSGKASIQVWSDGKEIYLKDGPFSPDEHDHSQSMGAIWCPTITNKLRSVKESTGTCSNPSYVSADCGSKLRYHFGRGNGEGPCDTFHILRLWNQFEKQRLSWEDRHMLIAGSSKPDEPLTEFQRKCAQAGLRLGEKTPYDKQFRKLDDSIRGWESLTWLCIAVRNK